MQSEGTSGQRGHGGDAATGAEGLRRRVGLLPAAGRATRLGIATPKELMVCEGAPVIDHSVAHLLSAGVEEVVVVTRAGKEAVVEHLLARWPEVRFTFVGQPEPIGNLLDALATAVPFLHGAEVHLLFPDTVVAPNPFPPADPARPAPEVLLLCHDAAEGERWRNFGVVDPRHRRVVEKPTEPLGSTLCWGAAIWQPSFTARLRHVANLTEAINQSAWDHAVTIARYHDAGLPAEVSLTAQRPNY